MQEIYYHRHRGLSTVFAKKFEIFFAEQKKVLLPPSVGGRRALFSAADSPPAPPCVQGCACGPRGYPARTGVSLRGLWCSVHSAVPPCALRCPRAACGVPCTLRWPPCALRCPRCALGCPVRPVVSLRAMGCPVRPGMPPCGLRCPMRSGVPHALWGAPCPLWGCPLPALGVSCVLFSVLCTPLRCPLRASVSLAAHRAPQYRARLSPASQQLSPPHRGGPLPRPAARQRKSPAAPKGAAGPCSFRCQAMRLR